MMNEGKLNPAALVTHGGGLDCVASHPQPAQPAWGQELIYHTHIQPAADRAD